MERLLVRQLGLAPKNFYLKLDCWHSEFFQLSVRQHPGDLPIPAAVSEDVGGGRGGRNAVQRPRLGQAVQGKPFDTPPLQALPGSLSLIFILI